VIIENQGKFFIIFGRRLIAIQGEEALQIKVIQWFKETYPEYAEDILHIANERKCTRLRGFILKLMGVQAGVADIFLDIPKNGYRGMWLELKYGKNKATESQKRFLARKSLQGYAAVCVVGFDAAKSFIDNYMQ